MGASASARKAGKCALCQAGFDIGDPIDFTEKYSEKQRKNVNVPICADGPKCAERQRRQEGARPNSQSTSTPPSPPSQSPGSGPTPSTTPTSKASTSDSGSPSGESWRKRDYYHAEIRVTAANDSDIPDTAEFQVHVTHELTDGGGDITKAHLTEVSEVNSKVASLVRYLRESYLAQMEADRKMKESKNGSH